MDYYRNKRYDRNIKESKEVVRMITLPHTKSDRRIKQLNAEKVIPKKTKKRSALEISETIGVYGAFGRSLSDLHKQGR